MVGLLGEEFKNSVSKMKTSTLEIILTYERSIEKYKGFVDSYKSKYEDESL